VIHPTARLYGPVILQEGVRIAADVRLIGPVVAGADSRVSRGTVLAQCMLTPETVVPERTTLQCRVLCGKDGDGSVLKVEPACESFANHLPEQLHVVHPRQSSGRRNGKRRRDVYVAVKCVVESIVALLGLITLSPLLALTAAAIKLTSRGPVFFYHEREGKGGKPFNCCKFRTMVADAHRQQRALYRENAVDGPQFDLRDDPRITWLGRWLRLTNVDELPQLLHVVLGQMSLIGPRPSPFRENQICVPWREARLAVRPGITGLWQICRHDRSAGDFHQWIHYDMLYVRHVSGWLDLKIFLATLLTAAGRWSVPVTRLIPAWKLRDTYDCLPGRARSQEKRDVPARPARQ
jgi:lipopolysaccharide/colanic/teichoic acid biosynthesis glycosyltransferase